MLQSQMVVALNSSVSVQMELRAICQSALMTWFSVMHGKLVLTESNVLKMRIIAVMET